MNPPLEDPVRQLGMSPSQEMKQLLRSWFDILRYLRTGSHHERRFKQLRNPVSVHPEVSKGEWSPDPWLSDSLLASLYRRGVFPPSLTPTAYASVLLGTVSVSNGCILPTAYCLPSASQPFNGKAYALLHAADRFSKVSDLIL